MLSAVKKATVFTYIFAKTQPKANQRNRSGLTEFRVEYARFFNIYGKRLYGIIKRTDLS